MNGERGNAGAIGSLPVGLANRESRGLGMPPQLLQKALRNIRQGDILMAHLGIWSRQDPWAPAVLEPLIEGLKARGLCFATLREHPAYREWTLQRPLKLAVDPR
jgi:peptidoglycan/xylan/chitin deacetylase (PgdA/CDA1 family)